MTSQKELLFKPSLKINNIKKTQTLYYIFLEFV